MKKGQLKISIKLTTRFLISFISAGLAACATYPSQQEPVIPSSEQMLFGDCVPSDGAFVLKAYKGETLLGLGEVEWVAQEDTWTLQLLTPIGQTLLELDRVHSEIGLAGPLASDLPTINIRSDNFLEVDGHFVAIKASEFPCLWQGLLPKEWQSVLKAVETDGKKRRLWFDDGSRVTKVTSVRSGKNQRLRMFCSQIKWGSFLFGQKIVICREWEGKKTTTVRGIKSYKLEWNPL